MYGRDSELVRLNNVRNDPKLSHGKRREADRIRQVILAQMKDKKLMGMRSRLISAARAGDKLEMAKISAMMKDYEGQDRESGHYGV